MVTHSLTDTVGGDLPLPLGGGKADATGVLDHEFDVFVAGLAFNLHITKEQPYRRETAEWRKEQVDQAPEAGEQSLSNWWMRSQLSFHGGAGIKYLDTSTQEGGTNRIRFDTSRGIDVWTQGEIKLLPDTVLAATTAGRTLIATGRVGAESYVLYAAGTTLKAIRKQAGDTITYTVTGMTGTVKSLAVDGASYYLATSDGKVFSGPIDNGSPGTAKWDVPSVSDVTLGWAKQRLMAAVDNKVYELAGAGPALPAPLYTHPSPSWRWTTFSDAPDSVIAAGTSGLSSAIFAFTITDDTGTPVLSPGISLAEFPVGETVHSLHLYVGSRLAVGTSLGVRVGQFDNFNGAFTYGPLSVQTESPVTALTGRGSYVYAGAQVEGETSLIRLDLGMPVEEGGLYAWAPDLRTPAAGVSGEVTGLTVDADGKLVFAVRNYGIVREAGTYGARPAWLRTARLRYGTVEPKMFKYGRTRTEGTGTITVQAATNLVDTRQVYVAPSGSDGARFAMPDGPAEWVQLTFGLTESAKLTSYQVLALPAQPRSRLFSIPVAVFDKEKNRHGRDIGYAGRAKNIMAAMEAIESSGDEVTVQCPVLGIDAVRCTVERIEFLQQSNPAGGKSYGLGGYANLIFRTAT